RRIGKAGRIEEGVILVDACVDVADLDASSRIRPATNGIPGTIRIDDLVAFAQIRMVKCIVLDLLHHRRACDRIAGFSVKLYRDCVKRNVVLTGYFRLGRVSVQPLFEVVPLCGELSTVRFYVSAVEVNLLAWSWLGAGGFVY